MEVTPVGLLAVALWFAFAWRGLPWALAYTICLMPFGMASAVNLPALGNLSLLIFQVCAALTVAYVLLLKLLGPAPFDLSETPPQTGILILLLIYCAISAVIFPRLFEGDLQVFTLNRGQLGQGGIKVGAFTSRLVPLRPSPANLSQMFYFALSAFFFMAAYSIMKSRGAAKLIFQALLVATFIHGLLAVLDAAKLSALLAPFRTANYSLLDEHQVAGVPRIIGGFAEASSFGAASMYFLAFFLVHFVNTWSRWSAAAALVSAACALASFSSTAYFAGFCLVVYVTVLLVWRAASSRMQWQETMTVGIAAYGVLAIVGLVLIATPAGHVFSEILERIIFDKASTSSALERGMWAEYGYRTFVDTYGLGAGIGSIRSNGFAAVYLGSIGAIGFGLVLAFLGWTIFPRYVRNIVSSDEPARRAIYSAARATLVIAICSRVASATTPDFGVSFMVFAALTVLARGAGERVSRPAPQSGALPPLNVQAPLANSRPR